MYMLINLVQDVFESKISKNIKNDAEINRNVAEIVIIAICHKRHFHKSIYVRGFVSRYVKSAVIFDMDGVLIDSEMLWVAREFELYVGEIPGWNRQKQKEFAGRSVDDINRILREKYAKDYELKAFRQRYRDLASDIYNTWTQLNPGVRELLSALRAAKFKVALASYAPRLWIDTVFGRFDLLREFDVVVGVDEVGGKGKPDPSIYLLAIKRLNIAPSEMVAIEDTPNGIAAAKAAGLCCIGYVSDPSYDRSKADMVITDFKQISPEIIRGL